MLDVSLIITIVPPIVTGIFAYLVARKKNIVAERISRAKVDADVQSQALTIVRQVMNDMREDFQREMSVLKEENQKLKYQIEDNKQKLQSMQEQMEASDVLIETLKSELSTLKKTLTIYEKEIERLRNGG
jgi:predicted  nucleic acid-binding Zn-ribbon protein